MNSRRRPRSPSRSRVHTAEKHFRSRLFHLTGACSLPHVAASGTNPTRSLSPTPQQVRSAVVCRTRLPFAYGVQRRRRVARNSKRQRDHVLADADWSQTAELPKRLRGRVLRHAPRRPAPGGRKRQYLGLWNAKTGQKRSTLSFKAIVKAIAFSADSVLLATMNGSGVRLWDADTGNQRTGIHRVAGAGGRDYRHAASAGLFAGASVSVDSSVTTTVPP